MSRTTTARKTLILDVAEELFSAHGFEAVSMRDISNRAEVSVALLTYHFKTKERLYRAIFERQLGILDQRREQLRSIDFKDPNRLEKLVAAFVEPQMQTRSTPRGLTFAQLLAREASDPSSEDRGIIEEFYDPMAREFVVALEKSLPRASSESLRWGYLFAVGAMSLSVFDGRMVRIGGVAATTLEEKTVMLKQFILNGLAGLE